MISQVPYFRRGTPASGQPTHSLRAREDRSGKVALAVTPRYHTPRIRCSSRSYELNQRNFWPRKETIMWCLYKMVRTFLYFYKLPVRTWWKYVMRFEFTRNLCNIGREYYAYNKERIRTEGHALVHDDVIKWKHFPRYWPFVRGIHRSQFQYHFTG